MFKTSYKTLFLLIATTSPSWSWSGVLINNANDTQIWNPNTAAQSYLPFHIHPLVSETAVVMGGKAYFIGGYDSSYRWQSKVSVFDPKTNSTIEGAPLTNLYTAFGVVAAVVAVPSGDGILVCGAVAATARRFENNCKLLVDGVWHNTTAHSVVGSYEKQSSTLTSLNGVTYLIGGFEDSAVFKFDGMTETWTTKSPSPNDLAAHASIAIDATTIMVAGGTNFSTPDGYTGTIPNDNRVQLYDTMSDRWTTPPMTEWLTTARAYFKMVTFSGRIYALGGNDMWDKPLDTVEVYDKGTKTWNLSPHRLPIKERGFAAVVIQD